VITCALGLDVSRSLLWRAAIGGAGLLYALVVSETKLNPGQDIQTYSVLRMWRRISCPELAENGTEAQGRAVAGDPRPEELLYVKVAS